MSSRNFITSALAFAMLGSCATVTSTYLPDAAVEGAIETPAQGVYYFLPKRRVTITATQTPVNSQTVQAAERRLQLLTTQASTAAQNVANARQAFVTTSEAFRLRPGPAPNPDLLAQQVGTLQGQLSAAELAQTKANAARDAAAKALAEARSASAAGVPAYSLSIQLQPIEPDPKFAFQANFFHNWARDDEFDIEVSQTGLLSSSNVIADDRLDDIIVELTGLASVVSAGLPSVGSPALASGAPRPLRAAAPAIEKLKIPTCQYATDTPYQVQIVFDPYTDDIETINEKLGNCFPYSLTINSPRISLIEANDELKVSQTPHLDEQTGQVEQQSEPQTDSVPSTALFPDKIEGLVYRPLLPFQFTVEQCPSDFAILDQNRRQGFVDCLELFHGVSNFSEYNDDLDRQRVVLANAFLRQLEESLSAMEQASTARSSVTITAGVCAPSGDLLCDWYAEGESMIAVLEDWLPSGNNTASITKTLQSISNRPRPTAAAERTAVSPIIEVADQLTRQILPDASLDVRRPVSPVQSSLVMLPNASPPSIIPMRSSAFVKSVHDVKFENGVVVSWSKDAPSEVLEVVRLPLDIVRAIFATPTELIQLRVNLTNVEQELSTAEAAQISAQLQVIALRECIERADRNGGSATECIPSEAD